MAANRLTFGPSLSISLAPTSEVLLMLLFGELAIPEIPFAKLLPYAGMVTGAVVGLHALLAFATKRGSSGGRTRNWWSRLCYLVFLVTIVVLAVSSFGAIIRMGHMSGYALLAHIAAAGAFVFLLLPISALYLPRGLGPDSPSTTSDERWWLARWSAWTLIVSGLTAAGTMFLSMLPVLGTESLLLVAEIHRYAGLLVVIAAIFHLYALICTRYGWR